MHEDVITIKNRKGKRVVMSIRSAYGKPRGTMVLLHGLGGWKDQYLLVVIAEAVRANGYNVVTFDAADGAKGPDADFARSTNTSYLHDVEDVIAYIKNEKWYTGPLILAGHSAGGLVAIRYAAKHPKDLSRLVLIAPAVSWKVGAIFTWPFGIRWLLLNRHMTPGPGPKDSMLLLRRSWLLDFFGYDAHKDAQKVEVPTLLVSAQKDGVVALPKSHEKLARKFKDPKYVLIHDANHIFYKYEQEVADTIASWIEH